MVPVMSASTRNMNKNYPFHFHDTKKIQCYFLLDFPITVVESVDLRSLEKYSEGLVTLSGNANLLFYVFNLCQVVVISQCKAEVHRSQHFHLRRNMGNFKS